MQELDAELFEEKSNGKSRTSFDIDVTGSHTISGDLDGTFLLVEVNLERSQSMYSYLLMKCEFEMI